MRVVPPCRAIEWGRSGCGTILSNGTGVRDEGRDGILTGRTVGPIETLAREVVRVRPEPSVVQHRGPCRSGRSTVVTSGTGRAGDRSNSGIKANPAGDRVNSCSRAIVTSWTRRTGWVRRSVGVDERGRHVLVGVEASITGGGIGNSTYGIKCGRRLDTIVHVVVVSCRRVSSRGTRISRGSGSSRGAVVSSGTITRD